MPDIGLLTYSGVGRTVSVVLFDRFADWLEDHGPVILLVLAACCVLAAVWDLVYRSLVDAAVYGTVAVLLAGVAISTGRIRPRR